MVFKFPQGILLPQANSLVSLLLLRFSLSLAPSLIHNTVETITEDMIKPCAC